MSHELRTPLNIIGSTQQLITQLNNSGSISSEDLSRYMEISNNNQKKLVKIINDLIDSIRMSEGVYKLFIEEKDIIYVIEEAALSLNSLAEEKDINLIIDTTIEECIMKFDETAIERCIASIVSNAIKFTNPGGEILINIIDLYSILKIEISDTGSGIDSENIDNIFDIFSQNVNSQREVSMGSGLELTIIKGLIDLHNGNIFVKSELGKGTTFTIILPKTIRETDEVQKIINSIVEIKILKHLCMVHRCFSYLGNNFII
ncbi:HAMP domain-containing histidine kinase [Clostridium sp. DSM 100503]|uniref:sensor histidine kinase n=1 Tax=Clostridium sp. DSM 100503 TaxID=2963282 RepID=UPI002149F772|nr:HAMP domain-containing sensor histidine kinase [Clostridium sp. DSM 100503]MCR1951213.1 HAMP domain-containing histidine kinase [Clostridium sp. DSM 100503]